MTNTQQKQRIVVVGGGFGGIKTALELSNHADLFEITLISERPDFWYFPTLYHTATGGTRLQSSIPILHLVHNKAITFIQSKAANLDRTTKTITLEDKTAVSYDRLVLALGVVTNYFGIPGLEEFSYGVKSIGEAEELKRHLHKQLTDEGKPDLNYVIVGGGPTGIELAGNLGRYMKHVAEHHGLGDRTIHVDLVEGAPHLLPRSPKSVGRAIEHQLRKLGVKLYLGQPVQGETADDLTVGGKPIRSHTVIWTAGQANNPFYAANGFGLGPHKKVAVDEFLRTPADTNIFVIGDNAETPFSGMAQTAIYDAKFVAENLIRDASNETKRAYTPKKPVSVIPAGHHWASVDWGHFQFYGWLGWWLRQAADFVAFEDVEGPVEAAAQLSTELKTQDLCAICGSVA
ncbi:MAG TPA: FAD-dependent oxidoreductase [Verrucomicrobiae bacterium]|nr:FAD-dependent oxidoreductase [Verrucomicrobiae bacterium]